MERRTATAAGLHPALPFEREGLPDLLLRVLVAVALPLLALGLLATWEEFESLLEDLRANRWLRGLLISGQALALVNGAALVWRIVLVRRYRPVPPADDGRLPEITVVVPAYNEGRQVLSTLRSLARSDYPDGKLSIVAVDDGSRDDTWRWMERAAAEFPGLVRTVRCPRNRGKRRALDEGFRRSSGQVLVTVDSDCEVEPQTLRHLVSPFVADPRVGAVAGSVRVLNRAAGLIPRMLEVSFHYSFNFTRASQSVVNTVMCTPGALSAYRRDLVLELLPQWLNQTFGGRPATIGEDRAMTNLILRAGHHVHFQRSAVVFTNVPTSYRGLCRMFLRWARSNVRETLVLCGFAWRRFRPTPRSGARVNLLLHGLGLTVAQMLRLPTVALLALSPLVFGLHIVLGAVLVAAVPAVVYALHHRSADGLWAFPYALFWLLGLAWITPYALLTPRRSRWLTRELPAAGPALVQSPAPCSRAGRRAA